MFLLIRYDLNINLIFIKINFASDKSKIIYHIYQPNIVAVSDAYLKN